MTGLADLTLLPESPDELDRFYGDPPRGVRANMIFTADGAAAFHGRTKAITDPADQRLLSHLRMFADVILVGSGTVSAENYGPVRLSDEQRRMRTAAGHDELPRLAVVTGRGELSPTLRIFGDGPRPIIATSSRAANDHPDLADLGDVVAAGADAVEPVALIEEFRKLGLERVLCEGGPYLLASLIEVDVVDEMCVTISPYLAGSQPTKLEPASARLAPTRLEIRHVLQRNGLLYLRYSRPSTG
jgi:riboflavin biosynthesis pyrimidine reductase